MRARPQRSPILLMASDGDSTRAIYQALRQTWPEDVRVILEDPASRLALARRRASRLGFTQTAGQVLFVLLLYPILRRFSRPRIEEIRRTYDLDHTPIAPDAVVRVRSVNSEEARAAIKAADPEVVVISGTRIISEQTLRSIAVPIINLHAGITPLYRGVHGAYWALSEGRPDLVGSTVHLVDTGIDTGAIIEQAFFSVEKKDNFATYPYLHTATGVTMVVRAVGDARLGRLTTKAPPALPSRLRFHPTLWGYLARRLLRGVR